MAPSVIGPRDHLMCGFFGCDGAGGVACVIVHVWPPTTIVPVRIALVLFRLSVADTVPLAVPLVVARAIQEPLAVDTVHVQPDGLATPMVMVSVYPEAEMFDGVRE